ncbi:MAG TPA: TetR/AcrR family transcriptional regulator [Gemmatimonadales bacterium]|nr:TetR/AcrR family transcriptional regulator [Gemmatimonadales bacterium]
MNKPDTTPDRLLATARKLFAERGYAATSVRDITAKARTNLGAVTYHFGSKEALYQAALLQMVEPMSEQVIQLASAPGPALDRVEALVDFYYRYLHAHPELPRFMLQILTEQGPLPKALAQSQNNQRLAVMALIERGQREGQIRQGPIPVIGMSIISQPIYFMLARRVITQIVGINPDDPAIVEAASRHARAIVRQGIAADPKGGTPA